jgi:hypothetical protein
LNDSILPLLQNAANQKSEIRLLNIYKGLPISNEAVITRVDSQSIQVQSSKNQIVCLYIEQGAYIQSKDIKGTLWGDLAWLDPINLEAILTNIKYTKSQVGMRDLLRVEPDETIAVTVKIEGVRNTAEAILADLSTHGLGIYMNRFFFNPRLYSVGTNLGVELILPGEIPPTATTSRLKRSDDPVSRYSREGIYGVNTVSSSFEREERPAAPRPKGPIRIAGLCRIMNVIPEAAQNRYRIGLKFVRQDLTHMDISRFITQRQSDIIREFKPYYDALVLQAKKQSNQR